MITQQNRSYCLHPVFTFWVDGVAMEIPIPDPGSTDKTLYCERKKQKDTLNPLSNKMVIQKSYNKKQK